jgi:hypothetical protein
MSKELPKSRKAKKAPKAALTSGQVYWLQIGFDAEEYEMLKTVIADKKMPAAMAIRQLILAEYRRLKG